MGLQSPITSLIIMYIVNTLKSHPRYSIAIGFAVATATTIYLVNRSRSKKTKTSFSGTVKTVSVSCSNKSSAKTSPPHRKRSYTPEQAKEMKKMHNEGVNVKNIALMFGVSRATVYNAINTVTDD